VGADDIAVLAERLKNSSTLEHVLNTLDNSVFLHPAPNLTHTHTHTHTPIPIVITLFQRSAMWERV